MSHLSEHRGYERLNRLYDLAALAGLEAVAIALLALLRATGRL